MKLRPKEKQNRILVYRFHENTKTSAALLRRAKEEQGSWGRIELLSFKFPSNSWTIWYKNDLAQYHIKKPIHVINII